MPYVTEILSRKGTNVYTVLETATVLYATRKMNDHRIGALVVVDENDLLLGMFTERDVLRRIVAAQRDPESTTVAEVMTRDCVIGSPSMSIQEVQRLMKHRRVRHLPILGERKQLLGLVSLGDINALLSVDHEIQIQYLEEYITRSA
jgi:CBS domain-containing protein